MKLISEDSPRWRYTEPAPLNVKLVLLTFDNQLVTGPWKGPALDGRPAAPGERPPGTYKAWHFPCARDKEVERLLGWL